MNRDDPIDGVSPEPDERVANQPAALPRPTWATVIGAISIVLGVQGLLGCLPMVPFAGSLIRVSANVGRLSGGFPGGKVIATLVLNMAIALLLLTAGIALFRQRRQALLHIPAGVLGLVAVLVAVWIASDSMAALSSVRMSALADEQVHGYTWRFVASLVTNVLIQSAYPGFLIIWFLRPAIRRQVLSWEPPPREEPPGSPPPDTPEAEGVAPIVQPREIPEPPPASWPKVIGICSIAVASLTGVAWALPDAGEYLGETACADVPLAVTLAGLGICLLMHRPAAMGHVAYAVFRLLWCVWAIAAAQPSGPAIPRVSLEAAYAIFLLVWFARKTTRLRIEYWAQSRAGAPRPST